MNDLPLTETERESKTSGADPIPKEKRHKPFSSLQLPGKTLRLLRELMIVFIGVFAAFLLNDYWNAQNQKARQRNIYQALYTDMQRFSKNAKDPDNGFIRLFTYWAETSERLVEAQQLPNYPDRIFGDYWHMEVFHSMMTTGKLNDLDLIDFVYLARVHTFYLMFLDEIRQYNEFYSREILPTLDEGSNAFYTIETGALKHKFEPYQYYPRKIQSTIEMLARIVDSCITDLEQRGLVNISD